MVWSAALIRLLYVQSNYVWPGAFPETPNIQASNEFSVQVLTIFEQSVLLDYIIIWMFQIISHKFLSRIAFSNTTPSNA